MTGEHLAETAEIQFAERVDQAQALVDDAMVYSGINRSTAPVRYAAAERCVRYGVFVALGLTEIIGDVSSDYLATQDKALRETAVEIHRIDLYRSRTASRIRD